MKKILIIGATSAIAEATAQRFAKEGASLYLLARNEERLASLAADLKIRGASSASYALLDVNDRVRYEDVLKEVIKTLGTIDVALVAHGTLGDQKACEDDVDRALLEFETNAVSTIALLTRLSNLLEKQHGGTIAVISSVAGDRGRPSNYVYGTAKAAITTFCEGLQARMFRSGVHVLIIKPGMVATPMTEGLSMPGLLVAEPDQIAADIVRAIEKKTDTLYTPWFWKYIMAGIIHLPSAVFKKVNL
ncbi:MAG: SDR family oxidoreductase [Chlorobiaceae bacterium]|nr:SDR family oxidoreductase [Chlorobiaceae bacterium]